MQSQHSIMVKLTITPSGNRKGTIICEISKNFDFGESHIKYIDEFFL